MSDPIYTGPPIGESEIFQTYSDSTVEADPTLDEFANTLSGEPYASGANSTGTPSATGGIQSVGSSEPVLESVTQPLPQTEFFTQDFPDRDPLDYDFRTAIDQSYAFLRPQDIIPEGVEAVYAATERDPFRQDWSEAEFRPIEDYTYTQGRLSDDEMNRVAQAYNFLGSIALEAEEGGWSSTEDYLRHIQQSNPDRYNELVDDFNINAGYVERYGDQYKFQANLSYADQILLDPTQGGELIRSSMNLLRDYVAAGVVSQEEAAYLAQDPVGLISLISSGDFTPQASQALTTTAPTTTDTTTTATTTTPTTTTPTGSDTSTAPATTPPETTATTPTTGTTSPGSGTTAFSWSNVPSGTTTINGGAGTQAATQSGISTIDSGGGQEETTTTTGTPATSPVGPLVGESDIFRTYNDTTTQAPTTQDTTEDTTEGGITEAGETSRLVDAEGRTVIYAGWDADRRFPFVRDPYSGLYDPPLEQGQEFSFNNDGSRRFIVDSDGNVVREVTDYPDFFSDPAGTSNAGSGGRDDGITAVDVPVTSEGTYDLYTDSQRALSDVADFYTGPGATLDLGEAFRTNFGHSGAEYDETLFTETERPAFYDDFPNMPVAEIQYYESIPGQPGRPWSSRRRLVTEERYLSRPNDARSVVYREEPLLEYNSSFAWGGNDSEWLNEKFDELVQTRPYDRPGRAARAFAGGEFGNPWNFDISTDPLVQQSLFEALVDYSDTTGVPIERIHNSRYEDIGSWDEGNTDVFDIEHFMSGSEDSGWGGFIPIFQDLARDYGLGSVGSEQDLLGMQELERMAFLSSAVFRPLSRQVDSIIEEREGGFSFDQNVSIPSEYNNRFGLTPTPDYLQTFLDVGGPEDEPPGLFAAGGYIGGIAGGMDDTIPASIDGSQPAALSSGEFVVPADVVSHLGDGNNQNGAAKLYNFMDQVRTVKTGSTEQPDPFNDGIMANMIGEPYGQ